MSDQAQELEREENWDFEQAREHEPVSNPRAVVSVAFRREDFERVAEVARGSGKKVSEYIREAALERANRTVGSAVSVSVTTSANGFQQGGYTSVAPAWSKFGELGQHEDESPT